MLPQPAQRRPQVMGDVGGDLPQPVHEGLVAIQHEIEISGEPVEFVAHSDGRDTFLQSTVHDLLKGPVHPVEATKKDRSDQQAAANRQDRDAQTAPDGHKP